MKWLYLCLFVSAAILAAARDVPPRDEIDQDDYDDDDYDSFYDYDALKEEGDKLEAELDQLEAKNDKTVKVDIDKYMYDLLNPSEYEFEDNRDKSNVDQKEASDKNSPIENEEAKKKADQKVDIDKYMDDLLNPSEYEVEDNRDKSNVNKKEASDKNSPIENEEAKNKADQDDYALLWGDDSVAPLPVPDVDPVVDDEILEETKNILEDDADDFQSEIEKSLDDALLKPDDKIIEETLSILDDTGDSFEEIDTRDDDIDEEKEDESIKEAINSLEVLADKEDKDDNQILEETKTILKNLDDSFGDNIDDAKLNTGNVVDENIIQETKKILEDTNDSFSDIVNDTQVGGDMLKQKDFADEDTVDKVKADLNADLDKLFDTLDKLSMDDSVDDEKVEKIYNEIDEQLFKDGSEELVEDNEDYEEVDFDKILEDINNEATLNARNSDNSNAEMKKIVNDEINEPNPDDAFDRDAENLPKLSENKPILFLDAIVDEPNKAESFEESNANDNIDASIETNDSKKEQKHDDKDAEETKTIDISNLNSDELSSLVKQFAEVNPEVLEARDFDDNTAEHIKLSVDNPVEVTSPNYPNAYPTTDVKDWVFTGDGLGIELNITDFLVNGAMGHYLLVKPGGVDDSGHDGLLFTYRLNSEKRFRFTDVDRLFVRFDATQGGWGMRGFQLSARMIAPIPAVPEPAPTPEPVLEAPHSVYTLHLAVAGPQFQQHRETFRILLAEMAYEYIKDNDIEPGLNATSEVTQITSVSACPVSWPNWELCIAVTFGIPLNYEEGDPMLDTESLRDMWETYSIRDPFALRLRQMGFEEFQPPSRLILIPWLALGSAVVLAAVLVVILLYRYNCFEDYKRMKDMYDTDSLANEKRGLDLYPTPHQTLPPLYAEQEYKWADNEDTTRVDMGGLANRSYARDMYDFESDDEGPQRTGAVTARDSYVHNSNA